MSSTTTGSVSQPSNLVSVIDTVLANAGIDEELSRRLRAVRELLVVPEDESRPFLTVLLRTQGKRIEPLKDALICLSAQTDEDFEVIVLQHDAVKDNARAVRGVLGRLAPDFARRVSLLEVTGGTRSRPLNVGVEASTGRYISVFDDDDLVFANWVEEFRVGAKGSNGRLLRAVVANQKVHREEWPQGHSGFRTESWPAIEYHQEFDQLQHLLVNHSPFMSWAFPRSLFFTYGVRFDEELTVCEDWDVILRGSLLCGVDDIAALTSIYRRWEDGQSSYTDHSLESWRASEQRVIERIDGAAYVMPPGSMQATRRMVLYNLALTNFRFLFNGTSLRFPLNHLWNAARPPMRLAVRARARLRRRRSDSALQRHRFFGRRSNRLRE